MPSVDFKNLLLFKYILEKYEICWIIFIVVYSTTCLHQVLSFDFMVYDQIIIFRMYVFSHEIIFLFYKFIVIFCRKWILVIFLFTCFSTLSYLLIYLNLISTSLPFTWKQMQFQMTICLISLKSFAFNPLQSQDFNFFYVVCYSYLWSGLHWYQMS